MITVGERIVGYELEDSSTVSPRPIAARTPLTASGPNVGGRYGRERGLSRAKLSVRAAPYSGSYRCRRRALSVAASTLRGVGVGPPSRGGDNEKCNEGLRQ